MLYSNNNNNTHINEVDTRHISLLMNSILSQKSSNTINDERITALRNKLDSIINSFNITYKELVGAEVKILNIKIAAEAINERNDLINKIHAVVMKELNQSIC